MVFGRDFGGLDYAAGDASVYEKILSEPRAGAGATGRAAGSGAVG